MKHFLLVNASPRTKGTSAMLALSLREILVNQGHTVSLMHLYTHLNNMDAIVKVFAKADTLVILGPSYINTFPADTFAMLEAIFQNPESHHGQQVYGLIQGGMPYAHTHESGLSSLEIFSKACGLIYRGGFVMGMGAMLNGQPLDKLINAKQVKNRLMAFFHFVERGEESPAQLYRDAQLRLPVIAFRAMARWINKKMDKDLRAKGIDPRQPSAYL